MLEYPATIVAGQSNTYSITVTSIHSATYEWQAPTGWSINNGGNTYTGTSNAISVRNDICMTSEKIKVRYKDSSHMYSEWAEIPTSMVAPAINLPSEIKQYNQVSFSLNLPDVNVNSVVWKVNGVDVLTAYNTSTAQFAINENGIVSVSAVLTLDGCGSAITIPPVQVNVQETLFSISGPSTVCPNSTVTFTLYNAPPNSSWRHSSNLTPVSGSPGTFRTSSSTMNAWVSVVVNEIEVVRKNFMVKAMIDGPTDIGSTPQITRYYNTCGGRIKMWVMDWQGMILPQEKPDTVFATYPNASNYVDVQSTSRPDFKTMYDLKLILHDGSEVINRISVQNVRLKLLGSDRPKPFDPIVPEPWTLFPNPASGSVTISFADNIGENETLGTTFSQSSFTYAIQLWSSLGLVKTVQTDQPEYQLDLTGVAPGFYYVHVIKDGHTYRQQLVVQ